MFFKWGKRPSRKCPFLSSKWNPILLPPSPSKFKFLINPWYIWLKHMHIIQVMWTVPEEIRRQSLQLQGFHRGRGRRNEHTQAWEWGLTSSKFLPSQCPRPAQAWGWKNKCVNFNKLSYVLCNLCYMYICNSDHWTSDTFFFLSHVPFRTPHHSIPTCPLATQ